MAKNNKPHTYSIDLDVKSTAASKQAFKELQTAFESSNKDMDALNASYVELSKHTKDAVELEKQYNKVISKRLSEKDEEIEKLKAEKVTITANMQLTQKQKEEMIALVDASIDRLEVDKKYIKAKEKEAKLLVKTNKLFHSNFNENSKAYKLAQNAVKLQEKLNNLIGKESKLRKVASKMASALAKVGNAGLKAGAGIAGGALALGGALAGAAAGTANELAEKDRALGTLKSGIDRSIVDEVYVKTGADYPSIIEAINNLSAVTKDSALLVQGAVLEIQNPGIGKLLLSTSNMEKSNISELNAGLIQIKKQTGIQDLSTALEAATKSNSVTNDKVSQTEYVQAFAALQQRGFDEEQIEKIIRDTASKKGNFIENLNKADLGKYTKDEQMRIRLANNKLGLEKLNTSKADSSTSQAQSTAEKLRELELKKNELLIQFLPVVETVVDELKKVLESGKAKEIAKGLVDFLTKAIPGLVTFVTEVMPELVATMQKLAVGFTDKVSEGFSKVMSITKMTLPELVSSYINKEGPFSEKASPSGGSRAQGGVITAPSLVGEAGPELVLPLDYSRAGRTSQIIQNFNTNQSFNMESNQQTPLAFSQAVGNNRFIKRVNGF